MLRLWNYIIGYLVIRVEGLSLEKFINLAVSKGIHLWKIDRASYSTLTACINIEGFKKLRSVTRIVGCRVKILDKRGLPCLINRFKHRKMLVVGLVFFLIILYGLSSFIWNVEVEGTVKISPEDVMEHLAQNGIKPGAFKGGLNLLAIENRMIIDMPELLWISIQLKGTKAIVKIVETATPPSMIDKNVPCNIVASKDGIIDKMVVLEGQPAVNVGDTVRKGQLLVSGVIEDTETSSIRYVHAMAQVIGRTWYEGKGSCSRSKTITKRTGRKAVCKYMDFGKWVLEYDIEEIPFKKYEVEEKKIQMFGEGRFFPISMLIKEYYEVEELPQSVQLEIMKQKAQEKAWEQVEEKIPSHVKIVDKRMKCDMIDGESIEAIVYVEVLEDIALQKEIEVD